MKPASPVAAWRALCFWGGLTGAVQWLASTLAEAGVGVLAGIVVLLLVTAVQRLRRSSPPA